MELAQFSKNGWKDSDIMVYLYNIICCNSEKQNEIAMHKTTWWLLISFKIEQIKHKKIHTLWFN